MLVLLILLQIRSSGVYVARGLAISGGGLPSQARKSIPKGTIKGKKGEVDFEDRDVIEDVLRSVAEKPSRENEM